MVWPRFGWRWLCSGLSMVGPDLARCGEAGSGWVRCGKARSGMAGDRTYCKARHGLMGLGMVGYDLGRCGEL